MGISLENFEARDLKWSPDGKGLILLDKDQYCCAFEVQEDLWVYLGGLYVINMLHCKLYKIMNDIDDITD